MARRPLDSGLTSGADCTPGRCRIATSLSSDGFGHQLDAKFSCVAAAAVLGLQYVHTPFLKPQSPKPWDDPSQFEDVVRFSEAFPRWQPGQKMVRRRPGASPWWPMGNQVPGFLLAKLCQAEYASTWFGRVEQKNISCCREVVYHNDNCFDFFNCHGSWPALWHMAAPALRRLYKPPVMPRPPWASGSQSRDVVLHVRRGDVSPRLFLSAEYYSRAIGMLRAEVTNSSQPPPRFRIETNGSPNELSDLLRRIHGGEPRDSCVPPPLPHDVIVDWRDTTPLRLAFHHMVSASFLVMARSSLSMAAALLTKGVVIFPRCYRSVKRPLPEWRQLKCGLRPSRLERRWYNQSVACGPAVVPKTPRRKRPS